MAFQLGLAGRLWRAHFADGMKALHQSEARWSALYMISDEPGGITQTALADRMGIQAPTLVRLLDALEEQGLVRRQSVSKDRRAKIIFLEPEGRATLTVVDDFAAKMRAQFFVGIDAEDLTATLRVLNHLSIQLEPRLPAA